MNFVVGCKKRPRSSGIRSAYDDGESSEFKDKDLSANPADRCSHKHAPNEKTGDLGRRLRRSDTIRGTLSHTFRQLVSRRLHAVCYRRANKMSFEQTTIHLREGNKDQLALYTFYW